ncbi:protein unc-93 homolog A-like [Ciona intestinalis]
MKKSVDLNRVLTPKECKCRLMIVTVAVLLISSAFISLEGMQSTLLPQTGLLSISIGFFMYSASCLFLPSLMIGTFGYSVSLVVSGALLLCYTLANFYPKPFILLPAGALMGVGSGTMWSVARGYVAMLATKYSEASGRNLNQALGLFFGIFYVALNGPTFVGGCVMALIFRFGKVETIGLNATYTDGSYTVHDNNTFSNLTRTCGAFYVSKGPVQDKQLIDVSRTTIVMAIICFVALQILGIALLYFFVDDKIAVERKNDELENLQPKVSNINKNKSEPKATCCSTKCNRIDWSLLQRTLQLVLNDKIPFMLIPIAFVPSFLRSGVFGDFTVSWISCALGFSYVPYVIGLFGVSAALGSVLVGYLSKFTSVHCSLLLGMVVTCGTAACLLAWRPIPGIHSDFWVYFALAITYGISISTFRTILSIYFSELFKRDINAGSGLQGVYEGIYTGLLYSAGTFLYPFTKLILCIFTTVTGSIVVTIAFRIKDKPCRYWSKPQTSSEPISVIQPLA